MSNKRRRTDTGFVRVTSTKRPIDKSIVVVNQSLATSQVATTLITATFPCTMTGLRWDFVVSGNTTSIMTGYWAIVLVQDGLAASTLATSDGADLYSPEQNVLAFGSYQSADTDQGNGPMSSHHTGSTKSMRKLKNGDKLQFVTIVTSNAGILDGAVQFFCKS